jgi:biopolymer transport protein TolR
MSMNVGGARGGLNSDINVTPLVDVMLVLLIIMMLVAPLLQKGVDVRLPLAANSVAKPDTQEDTVVAISADKRVYVNAIQVRDTELASKVQDILESRREKIVLIKADTDAPYSAVMDAMDQLRQAGVEDMGLITDPKVQANRAGGK